LPGLTPRRRGFRPVPSSRTSSWPASLADLCGHLLRPRHALFASAGSGVGLGAFGTGSPPLLRGRGDGGFQRWWQHGGVPVPHRRGPTVRRAGQGQGAVSQDTCPGTQMEHCCECSWGGMDGWWVEGHPELPPLRLSPQLCEERPGNGLRLGGWASSSGRASAGFWESGITLASACRRVAYGNPRARRSPPAMAEDGQRREPLLDRRSQRTSL
jgi:hypothetical protein